MTTIFWRERPRAPERDRERERERLVERVDWRIWASMMACWRWMLRCCSSRSANDESIDSRRGSRTWLSSLVLSERPETR